MGELSSIQLSEVEVVGVLRNLNSRKVCGPGNIPNRLLIELAEVISTSLCDVFDMSLALGVVPLQWKMAHITPVHKREDPTLATNYRPILLLCTLSKVLERCVHNHCYHYLEPHMYHMQHGFIRGKSTTTQLLDVYHEILELVASGNEVDAIYLDFSKAFDKVPHHLLLKKFETLGIRGSLLTWFESYLKDRQQRVVIHGVCSDWLLVTSGVPQGFILGPLLFLVYCNDIPTCIEENSTLALFADDYCSQIWGCLGITLQNKLQRLQNRAVCITKCGYDYKSIDILNDLELPNLSVRRNNLLCTMYQLNNGMVPDYLIDLFTKTNVVPGHGTRQAEFNFMPPKLNTDFGKKSFSYRGAVAWNNLTSTAKSSKSLKSFKNNLISHNAL